MTIKTNTSEPAAAGNHDTSSTLSELIRLAMQHVDFLRKLHSMGVTLKQPCSESFRRYKDLWLPLIAKSYESERIVRNQLAPPPDIAWLWHCHRLAPAKYEEYIRQEFAGSTNKKTNAESILDLCDPQAPFEMTLPGTSELYARDVWKESYPSEPFFLPEQEDRAAAVQMAPPYPRLCGFDLIGSTTRQATFLWQVSGPDFFYTGTDTLKYEFLEQGVQNYKSFLKLKRQPSGRANKQMLVPTYQIDLIWHTHILSSIKKYNEDCVLILGSKFDHDDSFTDRTHGGKLDVAYKATSKLWKKAYGTEYGGSGAYREEPPAQYFQSSLTSIDISAYPTVSPAQTTTATATPAQAVAPQAWVTANSEEANALQARKKKRCTLVVILISLMIFLGVVLILFGPVALLPALVLVVVVSFLSCHCLLEECKSGRGGAFGGGAFGGGCGGGGCGGGGCGGGG